MDLFITKFMFAVFVPGLLVILLTRVTFNHIVGLFLTVALIAASVYVGYTHEWILYLVDAISLTIGFWYAGRMVRRMKEKQS